jgi:menaquinone-9 beta-reductase
MNPILKYDVIIIGAGPAGATCALQLRHSGLQVLLIDKSTFPRSKTCGDAIGGRSIKTLFACCPELIVALRQFPAKTRTTQTRLHLNNQKPFEIHWVNEAYCCARHDFDNFLFDAVRQYAPNVTILENFHADTIEKQPNTAGIRVGNQAKQQFFETKMLIGADGAQSIVSKKMTSTQMSHRDHAGAVRAYFKGVKGLEANTTEIYITPELLPGYFWVFPLGDGFANVGYGMLTEEISKRKINLRTTLTHFMQESPLLRERFAGSEQVGKIEGFGLPFGSRRVCMSGDHFLLTGDAASLIDPATGDGISNAIVSGKIAAQTIEKAFQNRNFTAAFLKVYETDLFKIISRELRQSTFGLRTIIKMPFLINVMGFLMGIRWINRFAKKML